MAAAKDGRPPASIRTLWAIAKSPELALSEEDLHAVVFQETGKMSIRTLTQGELTGVVRVLQNRKDKAGQHSKRTDEGGDPRTVQLRRNDDNRRISAFAKRMTGVERIEWLSPEQCVKVIEGLKAILARERAGGG